MKLTAKERAAFRDHVALQVTSICMADLSRQLATSATPHEMVPMATKFVASLSYAMADALLEARGRK